MSFKCIVGLHSWDGCKCSGCGKTRDEQHDWSEDCKKCSKCDKLRDEEHNWLRDCEKCAKCGKVRDNHHDWNGCKCSKCGKSREEYHDWSNDCEECTKCGKQRKEPHVWKGCKCTKCAFIRNEQHDWKPTKEIIHSASQFVSDSYLGKVSCNACGLEKPDIEWVEIPTGTFIMGSPESEKGRSSDGSETQHEVRISAFKMSKYPITFEQYDIFCEATGTGKPNDNGWGRWYHPVVNVSWEDANKFAEWMGCRLPTEAEWEYACRAGTKTAFCTGNELRPLEANFNESNHNRTIQIGHSTYGPNKWGLFGMHGNVDEWCSDWYGDYPSKMQLNPKGPTSGQYGSYRVCRGGSWKSNEDGCRSAARGGLAPDDSSYCIGFRVVFVKNKTVLPNVKIGGKGNHNNVFSSLKHNIQIKDFRNFMGFSDDDTIDDILKVFGEPTEISDDREYDFVSIYYTQIKEGYGSDNMSLSFFYTRNNKKIEFISIESHLDFIASTLKFFEERGIYDNKLYLLGRHRNEIVSLFGNPDRSNSGFYEYSFKHLNVKFYCADYHNGLCTNINVQRFD